jgi:hypothetical protein
VTTSSMIKVAKTGVIDQTAPQANSLEARPRVLIARAAATARINTSAVKMAALLVSVSVLKHGWYWAHGLMAMVGQVTDHGSTVP